MTIRTIMESDIDRIVAIKQKVRVDATRLDDVEYQWQIQRNGFLLDSDEIYSPGDLAKKAEEFLVAEIAGRVAGFISCDHQDKYLDDEYKTWFDLDAKETYYHHPQATSIYNLGVDPDQARSGVATQLLKELETRLTKKGFKYLYSIVSINPVTNCPSLLFHSKNEFKRIAIGRPRELFGIKNYVATLLMKEL